MREKHLLKWREDEIPIQQVEMNRRMKTYVSKGGQVHAVARVLSQPLHQTFTGRFSVDGHNLWLRRGLGGGGCRGGGWCGRTGRVL